MSRIRKEYNNRHDAPLVNPPLSPAELSRGADVAKSPSAPKASHPWRTKNAIGVAKAKAFNSGLYTSHVCDQCGIDYEDHYSCECES